MPFIDTRETGQVVIDIPPSDSGSITDTIMDSWQMPLADVGAAGTDEGRGGKYVVLPPNYTKIVPEGYIALSAPTDRGYTLLHSIPRVPASQYWSATVYDRATHALLRNQTKVSSSSLNPELKTNADGSVDVYFGATAPTGHESNWVPISAVGQFEVLFRFYGPQKPIFDKSWSMPDIEEVM